MLCVFRQKHMSEFYLAIKNKQVNTWLVFALTGDTPKELEIQVGDKSMSA